MRLRDQSYRNVLRSNLTCACSGAEPNSVRYSGVVTTRRTVAKSITAYKAIAVYMSLNHAVSIDIALITGTSK